MTKVLLVAKRFADVRLVKREELIVADREFKLETVPLGVNKLLTTILETVALVVYRLTVELVVITVDPAVKFETFVLFEVRLVKLELVEET